MSYIVKLILLSFSGHKVKHLFNEIKSGGFHRNEKKRRRKYERGFKLDCVRFANERGNISVVAKDLGINANVLYRWKRELAEDPEHSFPGIGRLKEPDEELRRLTRENNNLKQERAILKKALAIFSKHPE